MCKFCEPNKDNSFVILNETSEYSGIEFSLHSKGILRCRYYGGEDNFQSQDVLNIDFCPICGSKMNQEKIVVRSWNDLVGLENINYKLEIRVDDECGWIKDKNNKKNNCYLSTHSFYPYRYEFTEDILKEHGFDVTIIPD